MGAVIFSFFAAVMIFAVGGVLSIFIDSFIKDEFKDIQT